MLTTSKYFFNRFQKNVDTYIYFATFADHTGPRVLQGTVNIQVNSVAFADHTGPQMLQGMVKYGRNCL